MTAERPAAIPSAMLAVCAERWVFHLDDPAEAGVCGVPAVARARRPTRSPRHRLEQVGGAVGRRAAAAPSRRATADRRRSGCCRPSCRPRPCHRDASPRTVMLELVVGVDFESLAPAVLAVPDGEHVLVAGPARSGRSGRVGAPGDVMAQRSSQRGRARRRPDAPVTTDVVARGRRRGGGRRRHRQVSSRATVPARRRRCRACRRSAWRAGRARRRATARGAGARRRAARCPARPRSLDVGRPPEPDRSAAVLVHRHRRRPPRRTAAAHPPRFPPAPGWRGSSAADGGPSPRSAREGERRVASAGGDGAADPDLVRAGAAPPATTTCGRRATRSVRRSGRRGARRRRWRRR